MSLQPPSLFILAIGNTMRGDDGIGPWIGQQLSTLPLRHADVSFAHDLSADWLEIMIRFDRTLLIDARVGDGADIQFGPFAPDHAITKRSSHYLDPADIPGILQALFPGQPALFTCSVPGYDFQFSEALSPEGQARATEAIGLITQWLIREGYMEPGPQ